MLILFGILEFGLLFSNMNQLRQGTASAARQLAVANIGTATSCGTTPTLTAPDDYVVCLTKNRIGLNNDTNTRVEICLPTNPVSTGCDGTDHVGDEVVVCTQYLQRSVTGLFGPYVNRVLKTRVAMRAEQQVTGLTGGGETSLAQGSWSFCTG